MKFAILSSAVLAASASKIGIAGDCAVVAVRTDAIKDKTHFSIVTMKDYEAGEKLYVTDAGVGKDRWWSYMATDVAATPEYEYLKDGKHHPCNYVTYWGNSMKCVHKTTEKVKELRTFTFWGSVWSWWVTVNKEKRTYETPINKNDGLFKQEMTVFNSDTHEFYGNKGGKRVISGEEWSSFEGFGRYEFTKDTEAGAIITSEDFDASMMAHNPPITSWNHPEPQHDAWIKNLELSHFGDNLFVFAADDKLMPVIKKEGQIEKTTQHPDCGKRTETKTIMHSSCGKKYKTVQDMRCGTVKVNKKVNKMKRVCTRYSGWRCVASKEVKETKKTCTKRKYSWGGPCKKYEYKDVMEWKYVDKSPLEFKKCTVQDGFKSCARTVNMIRDGKQVYKSCPVKVTETFHVVHPEAKQISQYQFLCGATTSEHGFDDTRWVNGEDMTKIHTSGHLYDLGKYGKYDYRKYESLKGKTYDPAHVTYTKEEEAAWIEFMHERQQEDLQLKASTLPFPLKAGVNAVDLREKPSRGNPNGHRDNWMYVGAQLEGKREDLLRKINTSPRNGGLWKSTDDVNAGRKYAQSVKNLFETIRILAPVDCLLSTKYGECIANGAEECGPGKKQLLYLAHARNGGAPCGANPPVSCMLEPCETPEPTAQPTEEPTAAPTDFCDPSNCQNWECEDWCKCYDEELVSEYEKNNCKDDDDTNSCICFGDEDVSDDSHRLNKMKQNHPY